MKIAIFENEYDTVEMAFKYLNKKYYNNAIIFENYPRSESFSDLTKLVEYDLVIIDLDLSSQSKLDGFGLIRKIENTINQPYKLLIFTGQNLDNDYHTQNGLKNKYPILEKPVNYNKLYNKFQELGISQE
ncbi:response regulator [Flavobacterium oreochromis]|uniref:Response regulator n=1 Tax=Flavobacterium oreochromis TaxID=2906078 RepID=A0ABW8P869_9FLAO|nr:response regulator [Flavobacterium oreochromis]OWP78538.1 hypothetical protein BWG23_01885 [Flavobacterium oreochromis]